MSVKLPDLQTEDTTPVANHPCCPVDSHCGPPHTFLSPSKGIWLCGSLHLSLVRISPPVARDRTKSADWFQHSAKRHLARPPERVGRLIPPTCTVDRTVFQMWLGGLRVCRRANTLRKNGFSQSDVSSLSGGDVLSGPERRSGIHGHDSGGDQQGLGGPVRPCRRTATLRGASPTGPSPLIRHQVSHPHQVVGRSHQVLSQPRPFNTPVPCRP